MNDTLLKTLVSVSLLWVTGTITLIADEPRSPAEDSPPSKSTTSETTTSQATQKAQLESNGIEAFVRPTTVTYQGNLNGADALIEIMEQTGNVLTIEKAPAEDIELDFDEVPFWEALDEVLDELSIETDPFQESIGLKLVPSTQGATNQVKVGTRLRSLRGAYAGVFRFEPTRISVARSLERIGLNTLSMDLQIAWEPRLKPIFCRFPMKLFSAQCDNGEVLLPTSPDASPEYTPSSSHAIEADLQFIAPSREAKTIKRMNGSIEAMIPGGIVSVEFSDLQKTGEKTQIIGKLKVTLEEVQLREDILEINLLVRVNEAGESMDSFRGWIMNNECFVQEIENEPIKFAGFQTYKMNGEEVGMTYFFDLSSNKNFKMGAPLDSYRLIYKAPGAAVATQVDFQLLDIPLP